MLSIIVTFYDETAYLRTALRSVRNQGVSDLELIVVNDNPDIFDRDAMARLTEGFDARVIHHTENRGLSAARNTGIAAANGTLIGFLDADDYFTPGGLAAQYDYAQQTSADITHAACFLGAEGSVHSKVLHRDASLHMQQRVVKGRMASQEAQFIVSSWSSLYRTEFLADNDLWFDPEQHKFEDRLFVLNTVTAARSVAYLGRAVRVWRRRANSISSARTTPQTHLLQVQLLEKCMDHIRAQSLPRRFEKRELFNCVSRLIWDMDILAPLAGGDPEYEEMGARIAALLGEDSFGQDIFKDPMVAATSRVGMKTRHGIISRTDFFALHKAWRTGDFTAAQEMMEARKPEAAPLAASDHPQKRLVLHIGLHKTGTTFMQHHLLHHRDALKRQSVLVPKTGFDAPRAGRSGALSGHQGLVRGLREGDDTLWRAFHDEVAASPARTVVISAENFSFPTEPDRDVLIACLFERLGNWASIDVVASLRAPAAYIEAFYAEWVVSAHPSGARSLPETLVDHGARLTDMPTMFTPFENASGRTVLLQDFDALLNGGVGLWAGFCKLAGLPEDLGEQDLPRYATPDRDSVQLMQLLNTTIASRGRRQTLMDTYFAAPPACAQRLSLASPQTRLELIDQFETQSHDFARARGYAPDLEAMRAAILAEDWHPAQSIPMSHLHALLDVGAQVAGDAAPTAENTAHPTKDVGALQGIPKAAPRSNRYSFTIRPRPWLVRLLDRVFNR